MIALAVIVGLAAALAILNAACWPRAGRAGAADDPVSVLVPARNEEARLGALLDDLRACRRSVAEILVYDDHSTDGTAAVVASGSSRAMRATGHAGRGTGGP